MMKNKIIAMLLGFFVLLLSVGLLSVFVKGNVGDPIDYQYNYKTDVGGPFESSNTTSRYILTEVAVTQNTYLLDEKQARFAAPDVVFYKNTFFSIFTPGVSFLAIPFYVLGQQFGMPQLFTFFTTLLFAIINVFLVARLAGKFGANRYLSYALGLTFLFTTNALAYSLTLTQHHYSVTVILLGLLNALAEKRTLLNNVSFGLIFTAGLLIDIPNGFMMLPILFYILVKHFEITKKESLMKIFVNPVGFWAVVGVIPFLAFFGYYNFHTAGSPTLIGQNLGQSDYFDSEEKKQTRALESIKKVDTPIKTPFNTRKQLSGLYILLVSNERGIFYYNAIVAAGLLGLLVGFKKRNELVSLASSIILVNIVLYSAFGDAWGGWSFGPRYLIPSVALLVASIGAIALVANKYLRYGFIALFLITLFYSGYVNTLGALTTSAVPPKVEAQALSEPLPYTYEYNQKYLAENKSSSLLFNTFLQRYMSLFELQMGLLSVIFSSIIVMFLLGLRKDKHELAK